MIDFLIGNETSNMADVWYHYKTDFKALYAYSLSVSLDELEILAFIERYVGCAIDDPKLSSLIILKDEKKGSMGLIWNLLVLLKKQGRLPNQERNIIWTLNNIRQIEIANGCLKIRGDASDNTLENEFENLE